MRRTLASATTAFVAALFLIFIAAPIAMLVASAGGAGVRALWTDAELRGALLLTAATATAATGASVIGSTPIAYWFARARKRGAWSGAVVAAVLDLPLLIPHPVAGIALLLALGRHTPLGQTLLLLGLHVVGSPAGIVAAMLFVSAPIYVSAAREAFARVDVRYEGVARTLGDSAWRAFRRVTLPLAMRGLVAAAVVTWARCVSEFGAIVVLTYNPKVASVLSYDRFASFGLREALPVAAVMVVLAIMPLVVVRALRYGHAGEGIGSALP